MTSRTEPGGTAYRLVEAHDAHHFETARVLFQEYAAQLGIDLCFQGFASELIDLPRMYGPPSGSLLLVMRGSIAVGCGALREFSGQACEMKRLYVRSEERGAGLARQIAVRLLERARTLGYASMLLDTLTDMVAARALYRSLGFCETGPYYSNPLPNVVYMKIDLREIDRDPRGRTH
jgi:putative acetyltransferase